MAKSKTGKRKRKQLEKESTPRHVDDAGGDSVRSASAVDNPSPLDRDELWKLKESSTKEEYEYLSGSQRTTGFHSGLVMTILAASIAGALNASHWTHFVLLACGPVAAIAVAAIGVRSAERYYRRFLEAHSTRLKVEADLGFDAKPSEKTRQSRRFWSEAPYWPSRWMKLHQRERNRETDADGVGAAELWIVNLAAVLKWIVPTDVPSTEIDAVQRWIDHHVHTSEQRHVRNLFRTLTVLAAFIGLILIGLSIGLMIDPSALSTS